MTRLILILFACFALALPARAETIHVLGSGVPAAGGGPDTYYYGSAGSTPPNNQGSGAGYTWGDDITATESGTVTTVGIYVATSSGTDNARIGLWYDDGGTWTLHDACVSVDVTSTGWRDATLGTGYSIGASETVRVALQTDAANARYGHNAASGGLLSTDAYAGGCPGTWSPSDDWDIAVRMYVD